MYAKRGVRNVRWFTVVVWMAVLGLLVFPAHNASAQDDSGLFLPLVNSEQNGSTNTSDLVASYVVSAEEQKATLEFWTHEALAAAKPLEVAMAMGPMTAAEAAQDTPQTVGLPGFAAGGRAAPDADSFAQAAYAEDWAAMAEAAEVDSPSAIDGTSQVYTQYRISNTALWKIYPHIWVGRLSFTTPSGTTYCSGTSISNNIMLTAAHCLYDSTNNRWYSNWVFTPAYRNGSAPYGTFPATTCRVLTAWVNLTGTFTINGWTKYDVGVCNMGTNSAGTTLNNAVGWMGRQWNWPYVRHFHTLGYPFRDYNDVAIASAGAYLYACVAESFQQTTDTRGMGCGVSRGMSGAPYDDWLCTGRNRWRSGWGRLRLCLRRTESLCNTVYQQQHRRALQRSRLLAVEPLPSGSIDVQT